MAKPGDYLNNATSEERKSMPMCRGLLDYFPDALAAVAEHSKAGNDKHNPGQPLHWSREKSTDHADCIVRHLIGRGTRDADGTRHSAGLAWRALALLQLEIEAEVAAGNYAADVAWVAVARSSIREAEHVAAMERELWVAAHDSGED